MNQFPCTNAQQNIEATHRLLAENPRTIHSIENNPIRITTMEIQCLPKDTGRCIRRPLLPALPPITSLIMRPFIRDNIRPLLIIRMHRQLQQLSLRHILYFLPFLACVVRTPDVVGDPIFEKQDVRVVEIVYVVGDEVECFAFDGRLVFLCPGAGKEQGAEEEATPASVWLQPHDREMVGVWQSIRGAGSPRDLDDCSSRDSDEGFFGDEMIECWCVVSF